MHYKLFENKNNIRLKKISMVTILTQKQNQRIKLKKSEVVYICMTSKQIKLNKNN